MQITITSDSARCRQRTGGRAGGLHHSEEERELAAIAQAVEAYQERCHPRHDRRVIMADDKTDRGPQDRSRINMSEDYEVRYWTKKFGITKDELSRAVAKAGSSASAVARELGKPL